MSAFEVTITPTRLKNKKRLESRQPTDVVMAPFSGKATVQFEDVPVGKTAKRLLRVRNPSETCIEVKVVKPIKEEHNVTMSWTEMTVTEESEVEMELVWNPQIDVCCKETLQFIDNRNFRKDVVVILKSKNNKPTKNVRKFPSISSGVGKASHIKTLRLKSPTGASKSSKTITQLQQGLRAHKVDKSSKSTAKNPKPQWQNVEVNMPLYTRADVTTLPLSERNTNGASSFQRVSQTESPTASFDGKNHLKENISPLTPSNVMDLIDDIQFTPATHTPVGPSKYESLATLPTPVYISPVAYESMSVLRPRRLTNVDLEGESKHIPIVVTLHEESSSGVIVSDKTFEVRRADESNVSQCESLSGSPHSRLRTTELALNRTTTILSTPILRQLEVIKEEETYSRNDAECPQILEKTYSKESFEKEDLKRDIKLVGTPLRKYSESMKDLSLKSSQIKMATQGSMPNLNEMEAIRSIEQNRYFNRRSSLQQVVEHAFATAIEDQHSADESMNESCSSHISLISHGGDFFNKNEILAQSSCFNLNEVAKSVKKTKSKSKTTKNPQTPDKVLDPHLNCHKRKSAELSFSDSQSTDSLPSACSTTSNTTIQSRAKGSPPKRKRVDTDFSFLRPSPKSNAANERAIKNWSNTQTKTLRLSRTLSLVRKPVTPRKTKDEPNARLYDSDLYLQSCINPDPFAATTTCDPFLASTMYLDERAVEMHQNDFKKWLNALVSIPAELDTDCNAKIDVGKLFNEVRHKELILAPTREQQSMHYFNQFRLESLRRAAVQLFLSEEMRVPCSKVAVYVNKCAIRIRSDRNLHLDVVMQRYILELLLCFNPLWLRLGLEVVYGEKIHLQSNKDVVGLSAFILTRLFRDKYLEQKYSKAYTLSDEYGEHIKKFTLQKMLHLLLFMDKAKTLRIIKHNPCLFVKKSPHKETKEILLRFSSELLANIGDITRELKRLGYVLQHKQTFLDEFDYAFNNLAIDLRDGIRLTRVMEIILLRDDLTRQLRVPAISRLQRVYNVNLALRALNETDFQLKGEISAADIVDGHREKTLSLLWQIIYKFRSPKFHAAAKVLQLWWRHCWLRVAINRRVQRKKELRRIAAATRIQAAYRGYTARKFTEMHRAQVWQAALVLQKNARRLLAQLRIRRVMNAVKLIQDWYRRQRCVRQTRANYLLLRRSASILQRLFRRRMLAKRLLQVAELHISWKEQRKKAAAAIIINHWRAWKAAKIERERFLELRHSALLLQRRYRAKRAMQSGREAYMRLVQATVTIQRRFRANQFMRVDRSVYERTRLCVLKLQRRIRATWVAREVRLNYLQQQNAAIVIQRRLRATRVMQVQRGEYLRTRSAALILQHRYRARLSMKKAKQSYQHVRQCVTLMQRKWRAILLARSLRHHFLSLQHSVRILQQKYRAKRAMHVERVRYQQLRAATIWLQRRYRDKLNMRVQRSKFIRLQEAAIVLQRRFRAYKQMRFHSAKYRGTRTAILCLQEHIRGFLLMRKERSRYLQLRNAAVCLQRAYRARRTMLTQREEYVRVCAVVVRVQRHYRATLLMRQQQSKYTQQRQAAVILQQRLRATLLARQISSNYKATRAAIVRFQRRWRATLLMRRVRSDFLEKRAKAVVIQRYYRCHSAMKSERNAYQMQRQAAIRIQIWYRSYLSMRLECHHFQQQRQAAIVLQRRFHARRSMLQIRSLYLLIHSLIVCVQRKYRAHRAMLSVRNDYLRLRNATIWVQRKYRAQLAMRKARSSFLVLRVGSLHFQALARGYLARKRLQELMTPEMREFLRERKAARIIQRYWRGYRVRRKLQNVRIQLIRKNIVLLKQSATAADSVRFKVQNAVHLLRGRFCVPEALNILKQLERISRIVPHLLMDNSDFISNFCYGIMAQAIRSEVDKQLIEYCSRTILNLARYNSTTANTFREGGLVTIAQMLLRWCDKDCDIFNIFCTLIWVFAHCPLKREIIKTFMTTTEAIYFVRETKKLVARKEKMKQNVRNPSNSVPRSAGVSSTQCVAFSSRALPILEPDYGIVRNKPYIFISSVFAFDTILWKLGIDIF